MPHNVPQDDPVTTLTKLLPHSTPDWPLYSHYYDVLKSAAHYLSTTPLHLSPIHVSIMAAMGTAHQPTMHHYVTLALSNSWYKGEDQ